MSIVEIKVGLHRYIITLLRLSIWLSISQYESRLRIIEARSLAGTAALALLPYAVPSVTVAVVAHGFYKFGKFHQGGCGAGEESRGAEAAGPSEENKAGEGEEN